jgi:hypothetical protein
MADSGQAESEGGPAIQQIASVHWQCNKLVCAIFEIQMDMDLKKIEHRCFKVHFANILRDLPSLTPVVGAESLRKLMDMPLQKHMDNHYSSGQSPAIGRPDAESDARSRSMQSLMLAHTQDEDGANALQDCATGRPDACVSEHPDERTSRYSLTQASAQ